MVTVIVMQCKYYIFFNVFSDIQFFFLCAKFLKFQEREISINSSEKF